MPAPVLFFLHIFQVITEDDILHVPNLENFGGVLSPSESETLFSILTVPYLRIPMILAFFATEERVHALRSGVIFFF